MNNARIDHLISRAVDGDLTAIEWRDFESLASADPSAWKLLALAHRDQAALLAAMNASTAVAEQIELPSNAIMDESFAHSPLRFNRIGAWTGWAVAALVALVATARLNQPASIMPNGSIGHQAGIAAAPMQSAAQAFQTYLDKGRESGEVVGEMPGRVLVNTRESPTGVGYEVIYLRQVMERTIVPDLYQLTGRDEAGRPTLVRFEPAAQSM
jgi:hypothetical protein